MNSYLAAAFLAVLTVVAVTGIWYLWDLKKNKKRRKTEHFLKSMEQKNTIHLADGMWGRAGAAKAQRCHLEIWDVQKNTVLWKGILMGTLLIGRGEQQEFEKRLSLDCPEVSKNHCLLKDHGKFMTLEDLQSKNHTCLNNEPVTNEVKIESGDLLSVGPVKLQVFFAYSE